MGYREGVRDEFERGGGAGMGMTRLIGKLGFACEWPNKRARGYNGPTEVVGGGRGTSSRRDLWIGRVRTEYLRPRSRTSVDDELGGIRTQDQCHASKERVWRVVEHIETNRGEMGSREWGKEGWRKVLRF